MQRPDEFYLAVGFAIACAAGAACYGLWMMYELWR